MNRDAWGNRVEYLDTDDSDGEPGMHPVGDEQDVEQCDMCDGSGFVANPVAYALDAPADAPHLLPCPFCGPSVPAYVPGELIA